MKLRRGRIIVWGIFLTGLIAWSVIRNRYTKIVAPTPWERESSAGLKEIEYRDFDVAGKHLNSALAIAMEHQSSHELGLSYANLGWWMYQQQRYIEATAFHAKAVAQLEQATDVPKAEWEAVCRQYGLAAAGAKDLPTAERFLRKTLDLDRETRKPDDPQIGADFRSLALVLTAQGHFFEGAQAATRASTLPVGPTR